MGTMPSSPRSAASTTLTSLTVEMLCAVADGVDARDLLSFRLVCREMSAASYERFVATFIAKRSHLYSQYGLQALVDLSASSELAKRVKEVRIVARSLKEFREYHDTWQTWRQEEEEFKVHASTLLAQALGNLFPMGTVPIIKVSARGPGSKCYGLATMTERLGLPATSNFWKKGNCDHAFSRVLAAVIIARFPIRTLVLCPERKICGISDQAFDIGQDLLLTKNTAFPFTNLRALKLRFDSVDALLGGRVTQQFVRLFSSMPQLKHLTLTGSGWEADDHPQDDQLDELAAVVHAPKLSTISLCGLSATTQTFISTLACFKTSVKYLRLYECIAPRGECWSTVFLYTVQEIGLEGMEVADLYLDDDDESVLSLGEDEETSALTFRGIGGVKEGLMALASAPLYVPS